MSENPWDDEAWDDEAFYDKLDASNDAAEAAANEAAAAEAAAAADVSPPSSPITPGQKRMKLAIPPPSPRKGAIPPSPPRPLYDILAEQIQVLRTNRKHHRGGQLMFMGRIGENSYPYVVKFKDTGEVGPVLDEPTNSPIASTGARHAPIPAEYSTEAGFKEYIQRVRDTVADLLEHHIADDAEWDRRFPHHDAPELLTSFIDLSMA